MEPLHTPTWTEHSGSEEPSPHDHLHRLEAFLESVKMSQKLSLLLENAEKYQTTVRPHIFDRVKKDYAGQKEEIDRRLEQERSALITECQKYWLEKNTLEATLGEEVERVEELEFRHRVGEYSEEEIAGECTILKRTVIEHTERMSWLGETLEHYSRAGIAPDLRPEESSMGKEFTRPDDEGASTNRSQESADDGPVTASEDVTSFLVVQEDTEKGEELPVIICPEMLPSEQSASPAPAPDEPAGQAVPSSYVNGYITVLEGSRKGERFPLICSNITLGSSPGMDIRLSDPGVANFHARIVYKDHRYFMENLDGIGRCYVNAVQIDFGELKDGDIIRLGEIKLRADLASAVA